MNLAKPTLAALVATVALLLAAPLASAAKGGAPLPDLVAGKVSKPPASVEIGATLKVTVKVRNKGGAKAGKSGVGIYLAKGKKHRAADVRLKRAKVKPLKAGKSRKVKLRVVIPAGSAQLPTAAGRYRLFACADDSGRVAEKKEKGNCAAGKAFELRAKAVAVPAATPAFSITDKHDWGQATDAGMVIPEAGTPISVTMTTGNGIAGQAGYVRTAVPAQPLLTGTEVTLDFSGPANSDDDGARNVILPFPFPFGGIAETAVNVGTNGWVSFGDPGWDYWENTQNFDYRGVNAVVGNFERGIMPYWGDLDLSDEGAGPGTIKAVVTADAVAFQWDIGQHSAGTPRRTFQLVLFRDGRFRLDYPGTNAPGGNAAFTGYSLGTGTASADVVANTVKSVPATSLLYTPNSVAPGAALPAGRADLTLPAGSSFVSGDPGCAVTKAPGTFTDGLASCPVPTIDAGQQVTRTITFSATNAPGVAVPANLKFLGTYLAGGFSLSDNDELNLLGRNLFPTTATVTAKYAGPGTPQAGKPAEFELQVEGSKSLDLDDPTLRIALPVNATLISIRADGDDLDCDPPSAGNVLCRLPRGTGGEKIAVIVNPSPIGGKMHLGATLQALNSPAAQGEAESPAIEVKP